MTNPRFYPPTQPFNSQDVIVNSLFYLLNFTLWSSYKNLLLDQDNFYLMSLDILITCCRMMCSYYREKLHVDGKKG